MTPRCSGEGHGCRGAQLMRGSGARNAPGASQQGDTVAKATDRAQRGGHSGVSIQDVAAAAGVSTATVSRAVRGLPRVSPATREKILAIAESLGWQLPDGLRSFVALGAGLQRRNIDLYADPAGRQSVALSRRSRNLSADVGLSWRELGEFRLGLIEEAGRDDPELVSAAWTGESRT